MLFPKALVTLLLGFAAGLVVANPVVEDAALGQPIARAAAVDASHLAAEGITERREAAAIEARALGRKCCCQRWTQFDFDGKEKKIKTHCEDLWEKKKAGKTDQDYCQGTYCVQQMRAWDVPGILKCASAAWQW